MRRVMCVYFPKWPLQRLRHARPEVRDKPIALSNGAAKRPQIVLCSEQAARLGIRPGFTVAEAVAIEPQIVIHEEDLEGDRRALEGLAEWTCRYSPCVGLEEGLSPQSLLVDITGCANVFRGEDRLLERAARELRAEGWSVRIAIADTVGAAWGLAHYASQLASGGSNAPGFACASGALLPPLAGLPVAALRLEGETLQLLSELGIDRVSQLLALPRDEIPARLGAGVLHRLDQALGRASEVITPCRTLPEIQASRWFEYATDRFDVLKHALEELTQEIHGVLQTRQWGARQVECCLHHEKAVPCKLEVTLFRPTGSHRYLTALLHTQLERVRVVEPVCGMSLRVTTAEPLHLSQAGLMEAERTEGFKQLSTLIDRLSNRLGREAVTRPTLVPDPQPEYACRFQPVIQEENGRARRKTESLLFLESSSPLFPPGFPGSVQRPVRLWPTPAQVEVWRAFPEGPPYRFCWAGMEYQVTRTWGPERIETGWWRGNDVHRDYYMVTTDAGTRFWLFLRQDDNRWFLHGCFD
jgi:protein ImuB